MSKQLAQLPVRYVVLLICGLSFLVIALVVLADMQRYTPVYSDVVCKPNQTSLASVSTAPLQFTVNVDIVCVNPNPYPLVVRPNGEGRGLLGVERRELGVVTAAATVIPAREGRFAPSAGTIVMSLSVQLGFLEAIQIASKLLQGAFTVFFDLKLLVIVEPAVLGIALSSMQFDVKQYCGMQIQLLPSQDSGDAVCNVASFASLDVPPLALKSPDSEGISPDISPETIDAAEQALHSFCGVVMGISLLCSLPCLLTSSYRLGRWFRQLVQSYWLAGAPGTSKVHATTVGKAEAVRGHE